jgi:hypothetical protein
VKIFWNPRRLIFIKKVHHEIKRRSSPIAAFNISQKGHPIFDLEFFFRIPKKYCTDGVTKYITVISVIFIWNPKIMSSTKKYTDGNVDTHDE